MMGKRGKKNKEGNGEERGEEGRKEERGEGMSRREGR
jgi:hypothetical protein